MQLSYDFFALFRSEKVICGGFIPRGFRLQPKVAAGFTPLGFSSSAKTSWWDYSLGVFVFSRRFLLGVHLKVAKSACGA